MSKIILLGDMPEFKENINDNIHLQAEVEEIILQTAEMSMELEENDTGVISAIDAILEKHLHKIEFDGEVLFEAIKLTPSLAKQIWVAVKESLEDDYTPDLDNVKEIAGDVLKHLSGFVSHNYGASQKEVYKQMESIW